MKREVWVIQQLTKRGSKMNWECLDKFYDHNECINTFESMKNDENYRVKLFHE